MRKGDVVMGMSGDASTAGCNFPFSSSKLELVVV